LSLLDFPFDYFSSLTEVNLVKGLAYFTRYNDRVYYRELPVNGGRRYVLCFNPEKFREERQNREEKLVSIESYFRGLNQALLKAQKRWDAGRIERQIDYYLRRRKAVKYFRYQLRSVAQEVSYKGRVCWVLTYQIDFERNSARIKRESLLDGVYVLASNLVVKDESGRFMFSALDLVIGYRQRIRIEQTFHHLKSFVDIRPIYHRLDERVRSHVIFCVLAELLNVTVEYLLKGAGIKDLTVAGLYEELAGFDACEIEIGGIGLRRYKIAEVSPWIKKIMGILLSEDLLKEKNLGN
jgi:hypothetical protein